MSANTEEESFKDEDLKTYVELFAGSHNSHKVPKYMKQILNHYGYKASFHTWHPSLTKLCLSDLYYNLPIRSVVTHRTKQQAITYCYLFSYDGNELKAEERAAEPPGNFTGDFTKKKKKIHGDNNCIGDNEFHVKNCAI